MVGSKEIFTSTAPLHVPDDLPIGQK